MNSLREKLKHLFAGVCGEVKEYLDVFIIPTTESKTSASKIDRFSEGKGWWLQGEVC